jgi:cell division protease FtsH
MKLIKKTFLLSLVILLYFGQQIRPMGLGDPGQIIPIMTFTQEQIDQTTDKIKEILQKLISQPRIKRLCKMLQRQLKPDQPKMKPEVEMLLQQLLEPLRKNDNIDNKVVDRLKRELSEILFGPKEITKEDKDNAVIDLCIKLKSDANKAKHSIDAMMQSIMIHGCPAYPKQLLWADLLDDDIAEPAERARFLQERSQLIDAITKELHKLITNKTITRKQRILSLKDLNHKLSIYLNDIKRAVDNHFLYQYISSPPVPLFTKFKNSYDNISLIDVAKNRKNTATIRKAIEQESSEIVLTWWNVGFRTFEKHFVHPFVDRNLDSIGFFALESGLFAAYCWWSNFSDKYFEVSDYKDLENELGPLNTRSLRELNKDSRIKKFRKNRVSQKIKKNYSWFAKTLEFFGPPPIEGPGIGLHIEGDGKTLFNEFVLFLRKFMNDPLQNYIFQNRLLPKGKKTLTDHIFPKYNEKKTRLLNWLRGGHHKNQEVQNGNFILKESPYTFDDVFGMDSQKEAVRQTIEYLTDPERYLLMGIQSDTSYMFAGDTRTGKTFFAHAIAGEINKQLKEKHSDVHFKFVTVPSSFLADEEIKLTPIQLLHYAKRAWAPCVLFLDEIDITGPNREKNPKLLGEFLHMLGSPELSDPRKPILFITATNREDEIDWALRTRGRFGSKIYFEYPDLKTRENFLKKLVRDTAQDPRMFDFTHWALRLHNVSFEDMKAWLNQVTIKTRLYNESFNHDLVETTYYEYLKNIQLSSNANLSPEEKKLIAVHLSGKALAISLLKPQKMLNFVTIKQYNPKLEESIGAVRGTKIEQEQVITGKLCTMARGDTAKMVSHQQEIDMIKVRLAGAAAEEIFFGQPSAYQCKPQSSRKAYSKCRNIIAKALKQDEIGEEINARFDKEAYKLYTKSLREIKQLLERHKDELNTIVNSLLEKELLNNREILAIIKDIRQNKQFKLEQSHAIEKQMAEELEF